MKKGSGNGVADGEARDAHARPHNTPAAAPRGAGAGKVRLGDVCEIAAGQGAPQGDAMYSDVGTPFIKAGDLSRLLAGCREREVQKVTEATVRACKLKLQPLGSLLFAKSGMSCMKGYVYRLRSDCYVVSHLAIIKPGEKVSSGYLEHCFRHEKPNRLVKDPAYPSISLTDISDFRIPLPPLPAQRRIADELDQLCALKKNAEDRLAILDQIVKSRFVEIFGDEKWPKRTLGELSEFLTSGSRGWAKYYSDEGELFITIKNVKNCRIMIDDVQHVVPPQGAEADRTRVREGDLLISITADLGRTGVVTREIESYGAYINQHLTRICLKRDEVDPLYAAFYIESPEGKAQIARRNQSAVKAGLNFDSIRSIQLPLPPIGEQRKFAAFVAEIDKSKVTLRETVATLDQLYRAKLQEYFG